MGGGDSEDNSVWRIGKRNEVGKRLNCMGLFLAQDGIRKEIFPSHHFDSWILILGLFQIVDLGEGQSILCYDHILKLEEAGIHWGSQILVQMVIKQSMKQSSVTEAEGLWNTYREKHERNI